MSLITIEDEQALFLVSRARTRMLIKAPFFGHLSLRLKLREVNDPNFVKTMATDGTRLYYHPPWVHETEKEHGFQALMGVVAHEVLHCGLRHMYRLGTRNPILANIAMDYAINYIIKHETEFVLPPDALYDTRFANMPWEKIYAILAEQLLAELNALPEQIKDLIRRCAAAARAQQGQGQSSDEADGDESGDGSGGSVGNYGLDGADDLLSTGRIMAPDENPDEEKDGSGSEPGAVKGENGNGKSSEGKGIEADLTESDWEAATVTAARLTQQAYGNVPGGIIDAIQQSRIRKPTCWEVLRRFISATVPRDYSMLRPNRRYLSSGLYLPGLYKENLPMGIIVCDSSGSMFGGRARKILETFTAHMTSIMHEYRPEALHVIHCDTRVTHHEEYLPDEPLIELEGHGYQFRGGGGTAFQPAFDYVENELIPRYGQPAFLIYATDMEGPEPEAPDYPVLWLVPNGYTGPVWFGEAVELPHPDEL